MRNNHIGVRHHFPRGVIEEKDMDIEYIRSKKKRGYYD